MKKCTMNIRIQRMVFKMSFVKYIYFTHPSLVKWSFYLGNTKCFRFCMFFCPYFFATLNIF